MNVRHLFVDIQTVLLKSSSFILDNVFAVNIRKVTEISKIIWNVFQAQGNSLLLWLPNNVKLMKDNYRIILYLK